MWLSARSSPDSGQRGDTAGGAAPDAAHDFEHLHRPVRREARIAAMGVKHQSVLQRPVRVCTVAHIGELSVKGVIDGSNAVCQAWYTVP
jgi:hypothetical protein